MVNGASTFSENLVVFSEFTDERGSLRVIDDRGLPFKIKRVFWIYDVPPGQVRGQHAHRDCQQLLICPAGRFEADLNGRRFHMSPTAPPLYVPTGAFIELSGFSVGAVCLVLCSDYYNRDEVIDDRERA